MTARALSLALAAIPCQPSPTEPLRYASACSGIDLAAVALDTLLPGAWTYVFASEADKHVATVLAHAHAARGLRPDTVHPDAMLPVTAALVYGRLVASDVAPRQRCDQHGSLCHLVHANASSA